MIEHYQLYMHPEREPELSVVYETYINDITFEELHQNILHFCNEKTPILLTGDFNGRTGTFDDVFVDGNFTQKTQ